MNHVRTKLVATNQNHYILLLIFYELNILYLDNLYNYLLLLARHSSHSRSF